MDLLVALAGNLDEHPNIYRLISCKTTLPKVEPESYAIGEGGLADSWEWQ